MFIRQPRRPEYDEYDEYDQYDEYDEVGDEFRFGSHLRLRSRYAILVATFSGALIISLVLAFGSLTEAALPALRDHYPWALLPLLGSCIYMVVVAYLNFGQFFARYSDSPSVAGAIVGVLLAPVIAGEWDGQLRIVTTLHRVFPAGIAALSVCVAIIAIGAMLLRRADFEFFDALTTAAFAFGALVVAPGIYVIGYAAWTLIPWHGAATWAADVVSRSWPLLVLCVLVSVQAPGWRRYWVVRMGSQIPGEPSSLRALLPRLILGGATLAFMVAVVLYQLPELLVQREGLSSSEYADVITQERRTLLAVIGASGAGVTLVYTHLRHQLDRDANATGRYTEAVQQLGNESMSIRLGGIYALARVARDSPGDRQTVTEVFAAFVRDGTRGAVTGVALDVVAALTELGKAFSQRIGEHAQSVNLRTSNFADGNLESVRFPDGVDLSESDLSRTVLRAASMRGAILSNAQMIDTDLQGARLRGCSLDGAAMAGANLQGAEMTWARLAGVDFRDSILRGVAMRGSDMQGANLTNVDLREADLRGVDLRGAILTGAQLKGARMERSLLFGANIAASALATADLGDGAIAEDIRTDVNAQKLYAAWRSENSDRRTFQGPEEYSKYYERYLGHAGGDASGAGGALHLN